MVNMNIETRTDIINFLFRNVLGYKKAYLEIGLNVPDWNYYNVFSANKECVDPYEDETFVTDEDYKKDVVDKVLTYKMTSDEFFAKNTKKYDLVFIDGLHIADQVRRDIINSYNCLNPGGYIVIHDCLPPREECQLETINRHLIDEMLGWNGSTWKAIPNLYKAGLTYYTVDIDEGCGIIPYTGPKNFNEYTVTDLTYNEVFSDITVRNNIMHVISPDEFLKYTNHYE